MSPKKGGHGAAIGILCPGRLGYFPPKPGCHRRVLQPPDPQPRPQGLSAGES